jgi:ribosomal protein L37AE/L43A
MSEQPRAEVAEQAAASPCPYCHHRPIERDYLTGLWHCCNCGESGHLEFEEGAPPRETAVPQALEFDCV